MKRTFALAALILCLVAPSAFAQSAKVPSPRHFKVLFENSEVRVLRANVNANDKTEPHELRDAVVVPLTNYEVKHVGANGKVTDVRRVAGHPVWVPGGKRVAEIGNRPAEAIVVEIKNKK
ncbi:MAG: hypothetical protein ACREQI_15650 [Candidatus Binataceae bacterium]